MSEAAPTKSWRNFWVTELPHGMVSLLTIVGVAYASYTKQLTTTHWLGGWCHTHDRKRLISTQILRWLALLVVIGLMPLPNVQRRLAAGATGLAVLMLLALGTFTAGVHALAGQVCVVGLFMAAAAPALAGLNSPRLAWRSCGRKISHPLGQADPKLKKCVSLICSTTPCTIHTMFICKKANGKSR